MQTSNLVTLYNPAEKNKNNLIDEFVVRIDSFDKIFNDIKRSKYEDAEQHFLVIGQRGAGKTTLLYRLRYAIEDDKALKERLIPINLGEEQYHINSLPDLWESISEILDDYYAFTGLASKIAGIRALKDDDKACIEAISKA